MKKLLLLVFAAIFIGIIIPCKVYAVDITVGATTWYTWWDVTQRGSTKEMDPEFLYGPALAVKFNEDFNLTFIYLYGKFDFPNEDGTIDKLKRTDSDLALNYMLNDYFKIFGGVKYNTYSISGHMDFWGVGPGLGLGYTFPLGENLFLLANFSGFYLWAQEKDEHGSGKPTEKFDAKEYGINSTLSIAYYIASASTTINIGGRYQYFKIDYDDDKNGGNMKHKFYGITLTATYTFSI